MKSQLCKVISCLVILIFAFNLATITSDAASNSATFKDVKKENPHYNDILWAKEKGIVNGQANNLFNPGGNITEAELVKIFAEYFQLKSTSYKLPNEKTHWSDTYYNIMADYKVPLFGYSDISLRNKPIDREHFAMVLTFLIDREHYNLEGAVQFLLKYNITNNQYSTGTTIEKFGYYNPLKRQQVASFMKRIDTSLKNYRSENSAITNHYPSDSDASLAFQAEYYQIEPTNLSKNTHALISKQELLKMTKLLGTTWFLEESRGMTVSDYLLDASAYGLLTVGGQQQIGDDYYFVYSEKHAKAILKQYFNIDLQPSQLKTGLSKDHDVEMNIFYKNGYYYVPGYEFPGSIYVPYRNITYVNHIQNGYYEVKYTNYNLDYYRNEGSDLYFGNISDHLWTDFTEKEKNAFIYGDHYYGNAILKRQDNGTYVILEISDIDYFSREEIFSIIK